MHPYLLHSLAACRLGIRSHALRVLVVLGLGLISVAFLAGRFSMRQPLVVSVDIALSGLRFLGVLLILFWMQETFVRDLERRSITLALSYPCPRYVYVLGRFIGVMALVFLAVLLWGGMAYLLGQFANWGYEGSSRPVFNGFYLVVLLGIFIDLFVVASAVLCLISISSSALLPFIGGAAFALASRSIGPVMDYLELSSDADPSVRASFLPLLTKIRWLVPDLSRLDWRDAVLYGQNIAIDQMQSGVLVAAGYAMLMIWLAVFMYNRREIA